MDAGIARLVVAGIIGAHGIGHAMGWLPALGVARIEGASSHSWLVSGLVGDAPARMAAGALFLVPTIGFVAAAAGLLTGQPWWRQVAVGSAAMSLLGTAVFPQAFPVSSTVGSIVVNVAVLVGVLVLGWGSEAASI